MKTHQLMLLLSAVGAICAFATPHTQVGTFLALSGLAAFALSRSRYSRKLEMAEQHFASTMGKNSLFATKRSYTDLVVYVDPSDLSYVQKHTRPIEEVFGVDIRISTKATVMHGRPVKKQEKSNG